MGMKKSIYFSLDAILFTGIIVFTLIFVYSYYVNESPSASSNYFSRDLATMLSSINVRDVDNDYIQGLISSGQIKRLNNSILEQIGEFWADGKTILAANMLQNLTAGLVPESHSFGVWIDNEEIYSIGSTITVKSLVSSERIISGIAKDKPTLGFSAKVIFSGLQEKPISSYAYFGGFVGDGKIMQHLILPDKYKNVTEAYIEFAVDSDFTLAVNGKDSGSYPNIEAANLKADRYNISPSFYSNFLPGINKIEIAFNSSSKFIGGGFIRVSVTSNDISYLPFDYDGEVVTKKIYLNGVEGVVNTYSSFYIPGDLNSIKTFLNYSTNYPLFVGFGNVTVYNNNLTGNIAVTIQNSTFSGIFNGSYNALSETTVPLRIGHFSTEKLGDFSRRADAFIATDISVSMDTKDVEDAPDQSRLDVAKVVEKKFVDFVLNKSLNNRLGLVSYHSSVEPGQSQDITNNNVTLKEKIDGYKTKSKNTCFSCAIGFARDKLNAQGNSSKKLAIILMSDGTADKCDALPQSQCDEEAAKNEAIDYACDAFQNYNISIYSIGYGTGAENTTLKNISADCTDGLFFHSNNQSSLQAAFDEIAEEIMSLSFEYQKTIATGVESLLSPSSYIEIEYTPTIPPFVFAQLPINIESEPFGNNITTGTIDIPPGVAITEAVVTSFSGDLWTESVSINSNEVFDLSSYNISYAELGDPFYVNIPANLLQQGSNTIDIRTASGPQNVSGGSQDDKIIYTMLIPNALSYSSTATKGEGCNWLVKYEDGTSSTVNVPVSYTEGKSCNYEGSVYDLDDAIDKSMYLLLSKLDLDNNGLLDINIEQQSLSVDTLIVEEIPSLWGPAIIEVRVWR